jgi:tRNA pseudouridine65 synthase
MEILYQDEYLVAVNKPAGLLVHRSMIDRHETRFALQMVRDQIGRRVFPVHRLDKPVSGVLLFALDPDTARAVTDAFTEGAVSKTYLAVVRGYAPEREVIDHALVERADRMTDARARADKPAQAAVTALRRLATVELPHPVGRYATARYSLLEVEPRTGRKHQIRRHLKHIFHPIVGDTTHGDGRQNQFFRDHLHCARLLLAATQLHLAHPVHGEPLRLHAPLDDDFRSLLARLGWGAHG